MVKDRLSLRAGSVKKILVGGIALLVFFTQSAFVSIFFGTTSSIPIPPGRFRTTIATKMSHEMYGSHGSYDLYIYYVGNKRYDYTGPDMAFAPKGEKYLLKYDTLYPGGGFEHSYLKTEHPVFLPGENTKYTVGTLKKVHKGGFSLDYVYTILGKEHSTVQFLADPAKKYPQLVTGAEFLVEYWVNNPERAILYMDKPKKDGMPFPVSPDIHVLRPIWDTIPVILPSHKW
jgi:hypothetical protein